MGHTERSNDLRIGTGFWLKLLTWLGIAFLFLPFPVLIAYSLNAGRTVTHWEGLSLKWYVVALTDRGLWVGVKNSILVAMASTALATVLGTAAALAVGKYVFRGRRLFQNLIYLPVTIPEIIFGLGLLSLFIAMGLPLGMTSIICAHTTFSISFVALIVLAKLNQFDPRIEEASLDLGATRWQTFFRVVLPIIAPGIVSGALFAFTLSLDDFVATLFTSGADSTTLPLKIYSLIKYGVTPEINAVSTLLIAATVLAIAAANRIQKNARGNRAVRRTALGFAAAVVVLLVVSTFAAEDRKVVNFYTYSDYISEEVLDDFERETGIQVRQSYYNDNEELLARLSMGVTDYDLVVPTHYMVEILIRQGLIQPIDFDRVPNHVHLDDRFCHTEFDPTAAYHVPYTYGYTGIVYDSKAVQGPVDSWTILWDPRYTGKILMLDDMREAFGVAHKLLGFSMKDENLEHLEEARKLLVKQKPVILKYESNNVEPLLLGGEAVVAQLWSGAALRVMRTDSRFRLAVPKEGVYMFVDNLSIPRGARHKENAEAFLNYLLRPDVTAKNMAKILYPMPNRDAIAYLPPDVAELLVPMYELDVAKLELLGDFGSFNEEIDKAWTAVRAE